MCNSYARLHTMCTGRILHVCDAQLNLLLWSFLFSSLQGANAGGAELPNGAALCPGGLEQPDRHARLPSLPQYGPVSVISSRQDHRQLIGAFLPCHEDAQRGESRESDERDLKMIYLRL